MAKDIDRVARAPRDKITAGFVPDKELGRALKPIIKSYENREHRTRVAAARAQIENATAQLELALENYAAIPVLGSHPVIDELRDTILAGRKMIARSNEIIKRMP